MSFTVEYVEYMLLILARIGTMMYIVPFFGHTDIPRKTKFFIAFFLSLIVLNMVDYQSVTYDGLLGYSILIVKEGLTGLLIGMGAGVSMYILSFSGHMLDMEIGFAMAMEMDPTTRVQTTISSTIFTTIFMLLFLASDMHYFLLDALFDSYKLIPVGKAVFNPLLYNIYLEYMVDYFVIGFRIILPVFACILTINVILGILAKVAPQLNMFVVGMQVKVFVGLFLLFVLMNMMPGIVDFLFDEMQKLTKLFVQEIAP